MYNDSRILKASQSSVVHTGLACCSRTNFVHFYTLGIEKLIVMSQITREDLNLDRRVTRTEEGVVHSKDKIDLVDRNTKGLQAWLIVLYVSLITLLVGQFYFINDIKEENQKQTAEFNQRFDGVDRRFDVVDRRFDGVDLQIVEVRAEVADNGRLIEENSVRLDSLSAQVDTLTSEAKETNERLAIVENVLTINHKTPTFYQARRY